MWNRIAERLRPFPARLKVARALVELGLGVDQEGNLVCGPVPMDEAKVARALGVDRRVVKETANFIRRDEELRQIFAGLRPAGPFLPDVAKYLGYGVIEIIADPHKVGILAKAATIVSEQAISIRQAVAEDPDLSPEPKLTLVTERPVPGDAVQAILRIDGVRKVSVY